MQKIDNSDFIQIVPLVPLRDSVLLPHSIVPVLVGRPKSIQAIRKAQQDGKPVFFVLQTDPEIEFPAESDLHQYGVLGEVEQVLPAEGGLQRVLVNLVRRVKLVNLITDDPFYLAEVEEYPYWEKLPPDSEEKVNTILREFKRLVNETKFVPPEILFSLKQQETIQEKLFFVIGYLYDVESEKQKYLEYESFEEVIEQLLTDLLKRVEFKRVREDLDEKTHQRIMENQKSYFLHEQMRLIQEELDQEGEEADPEFAKIKEAILEAKMPQEVLEKAMEEFDKLKKSPPMSPENHVIRNYLDWLVQVPWYKKTDDNLDISLAEQILDEDHYSLDKPKQRILEYLAVMKLTEQTPGAIICFVGPPGVGKTSLAKSIARALGRKFLRLSLGGVRDEAEIRGHRRTYIGAMPGKIIQSMKRAGVVNPVILLDEIDKMTMDFHGDPASALLEVLDPEQNKTFVDHYLDVDYDLSKVLFITTANFANQIPAPLYDRLEVIYLPGYLELEKIQIALRYLLPKQKKKNGIDSIDLQISEKTVAKIVNEYSREAGVRNLERDLATICRRIAVKKVKGRIGDRVRITTGNVQKYLGKPKFLPKENKESIPGRAIGLAWTQSGGDVLTLEVNMVPGKENFVLTGKLGEVMRESAQAALVYIKANTDKFGVDFERFKDKEIHLHVPEGAVPKDGPSAGITIATALLSELLQKPVSKDLAMTGEITIKGEVLPIGGLNEKIMAARRFGIEKIIIPWQNRLDLEEIKKEVKNGIEFIAVKRYEEIFDIIFG